MKKLLLLGIVVAMALSLVACGPTTPTQTTATKDKPADTTEAAEAPADTTEPEAPAETTTPKTEGSEDPTGEVKEDLKFGYIAYDMSDIWQEYSAKAFQYAADQNGVEVVMLDSKNSLEESITAMESLIQQGVDGISVFPISTEQGAQLVKMANEAGIPVTVENFAMETEDPGDYIAVVACEYDLIGEAALHWIAEQKEGAKVFFLAGQKGAGVYEKYQEGVDRALEDLEGKLEVVETLHADWSTDKAYDVTTDVVSAGLEFDFIFANNDMMAQGAYEALKDAGVEIVPIVATGGSPDGFQMLKDGIEAANMTAPVSIQGVKTFMNLYDYVALGKQPEKFVPLPVIPVDMKTLDDYIAWDDYAAAYEYLRDQQ